MSSSEISTDNGRINGGCADHPLLNFLGSFSAALILALPAHAQDIDPCPGFFARGIYCTHTPSLVSDWVYQVNGHNAGFPSIGEALADWRSRLLQANNTGLRQCGFGAEIQSLSTEPRALGTFEKGAFADRLFFDSGLIQEFNCIDTSLGYPIQQNETRTALLKATRTASCAPLLMERTTPVAYPQVTWRYCTGPLELRVQLKDLGPVTPGVRLANRTIAITATNAANADNPVEGMEITLKAFANASGVTQARLLSPLPVGQAWNVSTRVVTDKHGKATASFYWYMPEPNPTQRVGAACEDAGLCKATLDVRETSDTVIGFFNGVANTRTAAQKSLDRLEVEFGPQYKETPLKYDWFYNQTACQEGILGKIPCLDDVAEVFEARTGELNGVFANRWEVFWDILAGRHRQNNSWTGRLIGLLGNGGNALLQWMDATANAAINRLATMFFDMLSLFTHSPTQANQTEHLNKLQQYADEGAQFIMVAHSQGNLFVNTAFDGLKSTRHEVRAQVVHVAPASPTLRGDHVLADIDIVINGLRTTGLNSVPPANIHLPLSKIDPFGHSFEPTYLDKSRAAYARTRGMITSSLDSLTH